MKNNLLKKEIGIKIKSIRNKRHISIEELSKLLGVSRRQVQNYEKGITDIKIDRLYDISKIMNVDITYFFENNSETTNDILDFNFNILSNLNKIKDQKIKESLYGLLNELSNN